MTDRGTPIFAFDEHSYIVCTWFAPCLPEGIGDMMACLYKHEDGYRLTLRTRFYRDSKHWESDDQKRVWHMETQLPEAEALRKADTLISEMGPQGLIDGAQLWRREIRGNASRLLEALDDAPFVQKRVEMDGKPSGKA